RGDQLAQLARVPREGRAVVPAPVGALSVAGTEVAVQDLVQRKFLPVEQFVQRGVDGDGLHGVLSRSRHQFTRIGWRYARSSALRRTSSKLAGGGCSLS